MLKQRFLLLLSICMFSLNVHAVLTNKQYYFRSLDIDDGLSQNTVRAILQDRAGFMWIGTADGLNRYDGISFQVFMKENSGLGNNFILALHEDNLGQIWIGTDKGVYIYSPETESIRYFDKEGNLGNRVERAVSMIESDQKGNIWISANSQGLFCYNPETEYLREVKFEKYKWVPRASSMVFAPDGLSYATFFAGNLFSSNDGFKTMEPFKDADGNEPFEGMVIQKMILGNYNRLYLGTAKKGLLEVDLTTKRVRALLPTDESGEPLFVREVAAYSNDELWIGTESGLFIYNIRTERFVNQKKELGDAYSLNDNAIYSIYKDHEGAMWIGSYFGGINYYPKQHTYFNKIYPHNVSKDEIGERIREICADNSGNLWIGTEDKGLFRYTSATNKLEAFTHPYIYHNIHGLCLDGSYLWVGNYSQGLKRIDLRSMTVESFKKGESLNPQTLDANDIFTICRLSSGDLLIGATGGLIRYDHITGHFNRIPVFKGIFVYDLHEDSEGNIWAATYLKGLYRMNIRTGKWQIFKHDESNSKSLPHDKLLSIFEDSHRQIWLTTQGRGFCRFDQATQTFITYDSKNGLPSNVVTQIVEDDDGIFWIGTSKGLVRFNPVNAEMKVFTKANGLLSNQFNYRSGHKDKNGNIYFGSIKGLISFNPRTFTDNKFVPPVVITDFMIFNKKVSVGVKGSPLEESITVAKEIELPADQNFFSFRIAALSYQAPEMNKLMYKMEGFDKNWYTTNGQNLVTYSNLPYGTYTFIVKGSNCDGIWNDNIRMLKIHILPPFYLTTWAYIFYFLLTIAVVMYAIHYFKRRSHKKHQEQMAHFEQEKEREFYTAKIDFFTNVAHEIRTPLTLIKTPLENILRKKTFEPEVKADLEIMDQNAERLLNLTNQLLDFRKTESSNFKLNRTEENIVALVERTFVRFTSLAKQKGLDFTLDLPGEIFTASVDREAVTKIISNLLTNAVKYSATYVHAVLTVEEDIFYFKVCNDGNSVPLVTREEIFKPFVRYKEGKNIATGTGIGLALARSLAEQHQGILRMDDSLDKNCFILSIPIEHQEEIVESSETEILLLGEPVEEEKPKKVNTAFDRKRKPVLLLVEDNADMLAFISRQLEEDYELLTAANGIEGLKELERESVNLVVSDVMMPEMDGLELCEKIKSDLSFSHIPVILLTAKTSIQSKIEGLRIGADAYIEKPFSVEHLKANIDSLLANREKMRQAFVNSPFTSFNTMAMTKADELFMKALDEVMQANMAESEFCVDDMASAMNMSRSSLNRKIRGVLDMSPNDYIRIERLKKAANLLHEKTCKVNEVCYMVGFNTPSYFTKCFQKQFGVLPKDFE